MLTNQERLGVKSSRRKIYRARALFYLVSLFIFVVGTSYLLRQEWFAFGRIVVEGGTVMTKNEVMKVCNIKEPVNFFSFDRSRMEEVLVHDLRVEKVTTKYAWPNILKISVVERTPTVYVTCAYGGYAKLDYQGRVLTVGKGIKDASAPFVSGIVLDNVYVGDMVKDSSILGILGFLNRLDKSEKVDIAEISVDKKDNVTIHLNNGLLMIMGEAKKIASKTRIFGVIYRQLQSKRINAEYIDFTYTKPYIKLKR